MTVYMARAGTDGPVKIGVAKDVLRRLKSMNVSSPHDLTLLRTFDGSHLIEKWLHERFAQYRLKGEWFRFTPEMMSVEIAEKAETELMKDVVQLREAGKTFKEIGRLLGVSGTTVSNKLQAAGRSELRKTQNNTDPVWVTIDKIASDLGVHPNVRRVWRQRHVPYRWRLPILREAERSGVDLKDSDFDQRYAETRGAA